MDGLTTKEAFEKLINERNFHQGIEGLTPESARMLRSNFKKGKVSLDRMEEIMEVIMDKAFTVRNIRGDVDNQRQILRKYEYFFADGKISMEDLHKVIASTTQVMANLNKILKDLSEIGLEPVGEEARAGA
jgi:hypothetical protein